MATAHPYATLAHTVLTYPAIDNHAHPLLADKHRDAFPFEKLVSEAAGASEADIPHLLAFHNATARLAELYEIPPFTKVEEPEIVAANPSETAPETIPGTGPDSTWTALKEYRATAPYEQICKRAFKACHLETILFDDGLGGVRELCSPREWHDQFVHSSCKRIVRVETVAQDILCTLFADLYRADRTRTRRPDRTFCAVWLTTVIHSLRDVIRDANVVGFKSVVCYRTGLAVEPLPAEIIQAITGFPKPTLEDIVSASYAPALALIEDLRIAPKLVDGIVMLYERFALEKAQHEAKGLLSMPNVRIEHKTLNDILVGITMAISAACHKPVQFHTGLGDSEIVLARSSPAYLQPLIDANPKAIFVLLHCSYPYTREGAYLCNVYDNVYLDFGEVFAAVSGDGCREVIRQILELAPGNKIMWSSDGHWWPESFYLGSLMAREALLEVLTSAIRTSRLPVSTAIQMAKDALFNTANRIYELNLAPPEF